MDSEATVHVGRYLIDYLSIPKPSNPFTYDYHTVKVKHEMRNIVSLYYSN